jgi:hypothetical protein
MWVYFLVPDCIGVYLTIPGYVAVAAAVSF